MCKFEVTLPILSKFMLLYSLRCGSIIILIWTILRSLFCFMFFVTVILELLIQSSWIFGRAFPKKDKETPVTKYIPEVYLCYILLILAEAFILIFTYYLARALCLYASRPLISYLMCRKFAWFIEVVCLIILCVIQKSLIGWYLGFLFFVILEVYSWVIVYSYYWQLKDREIKGEEDYDDEQ